MTYVLETDERFPALERLDDHGRPYVHADAAGGSHVPESVIAAITEQLSSLNTNPSRPHPLSGLAAKAISDVRDAFARFADCDSQGVVFGPNSTSLAWHFARAVEHHLNPGDVIVCTQLDHEANVAPWLAVAKRRQAQVRFVRLHPFTYQPDLESLAGAVNERTRIVAFTRASNLTGTIVSPEPFVRVARAVGALTFADAVHAAAHVPLAQNEWGIDVQVTSPYKFFGPHMGVLSARPEVLERFEPDRVRPAGSDPARWQTGMPNFEAIAGLGAALRYIQRVGHGRIAIHERQLSAMALAQLRAINGLRLLGLPEPDDRTPTFAIDTRPHDPAEIARELGKRGVLVSAGSNYAIETLRALRIDERQGVLRISFAHYHRPDEISRTFGALAHIVEARRRQRSESPAVR